MKMGLVIPSLVVVLAVSQAIATNPGVKMRVTKKGFDYANTVAKAVIAQELSGLKIPNQSGDDHHMSWSLTNIQVKGTTPPNTNIQLNPGAGGITLALSNFGISLKSDWRVKYKKGWVKISTSGSVDIGVSGVSVTLTAGFGVDKDGRPSITAKTCNSHIGDVSIHFHGGTAFILNLFKGVVEDKVKKILSGQICTIVNKEVNVDAENALKKMKVTVEMDHRFLLDYGLVAPPVIIASYLETNHKGEVYWKANKTEAPFSPDPIPAWTDVSNMLYLWGTEYTAKSMAYVAHKNNYLKYNLTQNDLPADKKSYLNTTCKGICVGKLIPEIGKKYPNSVVEVHVKSNAVPVTKLTSKNITIALNADVEAYVDTPDKKETFLLALNVNLSLSVSVSIVKERLVGEIVDHGFNLDVRKSAIGPVKAQSLNLLIKGALDLIVIPDFNKIAEAGIDLPVTGNVAFKDTKLVLLNGSILVATDVIYKPASSTLWVVSEKH